MRCRCSLGGLPLREQPAGDQHDGEVQEHEIGAAGQEGPARMGFQGGQDRQVSGGGAAQPGLDAKPEQAQPEGVPDQGLENAPDRPGLVRIVPAPLPGHGRAPGSRGSPGSPPAGRPVRVPTPRCRAPSAANSTPTNTGSIPRDPRMRAFAVGRRSAARMGLRCKSLGGGVVLFEGAGIPPLLGSARFWTRW